jgi:hypothetical protein
MDVGGKVILNDFDGKWVYVSRLVIEEEKLVGSNVVVINGCSLDSKYERCRRAEICQRTHLYRNDPFRFPSIRRGL